MLDPLDLQIVGALQVDGRASWRRIADVLGEPVRTVSRRGGQLLDDGTVRITALRTTALAALVRAECRPGGAAAVADELAARPDAVFAYSTGTGSVWAEVVLADQAALADVLTGAVEPGGRLPTTWPAELADAPVTEVVPTDGRLEYTEGLHIGHRGYLRAGTTPAYWFGHGLGYTTWAWEQLTVDGATATVRLRNTGERAGKQVVQVYAARPDSSLDRPVRWLAGFAVVHAGPGEVVDVPVAIGPRVLRHRVAGAWAVEPGVVVLSSGPSAGEQLVHADLQL